MNRLKEIRFFKNVSQYELAKKADVHQSRISLIENDLSAPRSHEIKKIAEALGVKEDEIWGEAEVRV